MTFQTGNLFDHLPFNAVPVVTTNSYLKQDGSLVMGRGAALAAKTYFPGLPHLAGRAIKQTGSVYGLLFMIVINTHDESFKLEEGQLERKTQRVGLFQVKENFRDAARLDLIEKAVKRLVAAATLEPLTEFRLNYPGIGNGRLTKDDVGAYLEPLKKFDNVSIWQL